MRKLKKNLANRSSATKTACTPMYANQLSNVGILAMVVVASRKTGEHTFYKASGGVRLAWHVRGTSSGSTRPIKFKHSFGISGLPESTHFISAHTLRAFPNNPSLCIEMSGSSSDGEHDFACGDAEAAFGSPVRAGELKKGEFVLIQGHPCKVCKKLDSILLYLPYFQLQNACMFKPRRCLPGRQVLAHEGLFSQIVDVAKSKSGKHGHSKVNVVGLDVFYASKHAAFWPSSHTAVAPEGKQDALRVRCT